MEQARIEKAIGSSLDAKVLLYVTDTQLRQSLESFNPADSLASNGVDELRYFLLASQVELVDSVEVIEQAEYNSKDADLGIGIVKAEGTKCAAKCSRCWNYSTRVGEFPEDPTICERCNAALAGEF
jgi:isoleucyl-tRNA synthetase